MDAKIKHLGKVLLCGLFFIGLTFDSRSIHAANLPVKKIKVQDDEFSESSEDEFLDAEQPVTENSSKASNKDSESLEENEDDEFLEESEPAAAQPEPAKTTQANQAEDKKIQSAKPKQVDTATEELKSFIASTETRVFRGSPVTIRLRDADITEVLQMIADASGFNIILTRGVQGRVTLNLIDVPWDQALDEILRVNGLGAERNNNILRIMTLQELQSTKVAERDAQRAALEVAPRLTRIFRISYAELTAISTIVNGFIAPITGSTTPAIQTDTRTNSLIIRATADELARIEKVIQVLDTQTPQVMIEAKIVEGSESFSRAMGGSLGIGRNNATFYGASFSGGAVSDQLIGTDIEGSTGGGSFGFSPDLSNISFAGIDRINAFLNIAAAEEEAEIVASPKVVVLDRQSASLTQGNPGVNIVTTESAGGATNSSPQQVDANLTLNVTPTVTNDESVLLQITLSRGIPRVIGTSTVVANRDFNTQVIVDNGSTLVLGGVFSVDQNSSSSGFPILKDLPLLGVLFGSKTKATTKTELFAFVTPTIINTGRAGFNTLE